MRSLLAVPLLVALLAGCSGSGDEGISVSGEAGSQGPYTFRGPSGADNYTWDMGDQLTRLYGREVTHTYDFHNGKATVQLKTRTGAQEATHTTQVTVGSGTNAQPTMYLDAQTNWTIPGEAVRFSGAASTDPDGDRLRYTWTCFREGDAVRIGFHPPHGPTGGVPYGSNTQGKVVPRLAAGPLPAPDLTLEGDLCDALEDNTRPSLGATVEGAFTRTGKYRITMVAGDGQYSSLGQWQLIVSEATERPEPVFAESFSGNLSLGVPQAEPANILFRADHTVTLPLSAKEANVTLQFTGAAGAVLDGSWSLRRGDVEVASGGTGTARFEEDLQMETAYTLRVQLEQGAGAGYTIHFEAPLVLDPFTVY